MSRYPLGAHQGILECPINRVGLPSPDRVAPTRTSTRSDVGRARPTRARARDQGANVRRHPGCAASVHRIRKSVDETVKTREIREFSDSQRALTAIWYCLSPRNRRDPGPSARVWAERKLPFRGPGPTARTSDALPAILGRPPDGKIGGRTAQQQCPVPRIAASPRENVAEMPSGPSAVGSDARVALRAVPPANGALRAASGLWERSGRFPGAGWRRGTRLSAIGPGSAFGGGRSRQLRESAG